MVKIEGPDFLKAMKDAVLADWGGEEDNVEDYVVRIKIVMLGLGVEYCINSVLAYMAFGDVKKHQWVHNWIPTDNIEVWYCGSVPASRVEIP